MTSPDWDLQTARPAADYRCLEVPAITDDGKPSSHYMPIVPIELDGDKLTLLVPSDFVPWLPPHFVALSDGVGTEPAADGQTCEWAGQPNSVILEFTVRVESSSQKTVEWPFDQTVNKTVKP